MARKEPLCAFLALCLSAADERLTASSRKEKGGPPDVKKYTLKRILTSLFTLLAILLVLFILMQLMPDRGAQEAARAGYAGRQL